MNPSIQSQAEQAAKEGQQLLASDQSTAAQSKGDYTNYSNQANQTNQQLTAATAYLQGQGSGENTYNRELNTQEGNAGFNPQTLSDANSSLFALNGALNSANKQFSTAGGVGTYGMSAPSIASYEGSILNPLTTGVSNANTEVGTLNSELGTLETGANQATTSEVQGENSAIGGLTAAVQNYQAQAASALQNMQFYSNLAQTQGGLNAQQQQEYAAATNAYAQASLLISQTTGQNLQNQAATNALKTPAPPTPNAKPAAPAAAPKPAVSTPQQIAATNVGPQVAATAYNPNYKPSLMQQLIGTGGQRLVHDIGSIF